jgi:hypothetical protein
MAKFQETASVSLTDDDFVAVSVQRAYDDGVQYRSVLYFQRADATKVADAVERFLRAQLDDNVALVDGSVHLFPQERGNMINVELTRDDALPHGGYDTLDFSPDSAATVIAGLRQHAA